MNPYVLLSSKFGTAEAATLAARLATWHDAMVTHERHLRTNGIAMRCGDECPHAEALSLWAEALVIFGARAGELTFLRSRAARQGVEFDGDDSSPPSGRSNRPGDSPSTAITT